MEITTCRMDGCSHGKDRTTGHSHRRRLLPWVRKDYQRIACSPGATTDAVSRLHSYSLQDEMA